MAPFFDPAPPFRPSEYRCQVAQNRWEHDAYFALRKRVFCGEQGIFSGHDRDPIDQNSIAIVAISLLGVTVGDVVGCVRIDEREPGVWFGSRLAVSPDHRGVAPMAPHLIRKAVCTAHSLGCKRFMAHVQRANVRMFRRLNWDKRGALTVHGRPHELMEADLEHYPAVETQRPIEIIMDRGAA
ncbi:MAG: MSMEG_0567/Sll0786 family nitrogen starvation N-acetyltransferase [Planctomycetota bacterium]